MKAVCSCKDISRPDDCSTQTTYVRTFFAIMIIPVREKVSVAAATPNQVCQWNTAAMA